MKNRPGAEGVPSVEIQKGPDRVKGLPRLLGGLSLMAAAAIFEQGCNVQSLPDGTMIISPDLSTSGSQRETTARPTPERTRYPEATNEQLEQVYADFSRDVTRTLTTDFSERLPHQLPRLSGPGTSFMRTGLRFNSMEQTDRDQIVNGLFRHVQAANRRPDQILVLDVRSASVVMEVSRRDGVRIDPQMNRGRSVAISTAERTAADQVNLPSGDEYMIAERELPRNSPLTDEDESYHGRGSTQQEALAAAIQQLVEQAPNGLQPIEVDEGTFHAPHASGNPDVHIRHEQRNTVIHVRDLRVNYENTNGVVNATLEGSYRLIARRQRAGEDAIAADPIVRPIVLP